MRSIESSNREIPGQVLAGRIEVWSHLRAHLAIVRRRTRCDPVTGDMLWCAHESARLLHLGEPVALTGSDESESLTGATASQAPRARKRELPAVERLLFDEISSVLGRA